MSQASTSTPSRARQTFADMARSLGLLIAIVAVLLLIGPARSLILPGARDRMPAVSYTHVAATFDGQAHGDALLPATLPAGWRANAARLTDDGAVVDAQLHIGWAVPGNAYAGLDETRTDGAALAATVLGAHARRTGSVEIGGAAWEVRRAGDGTAALVRRNGQVTVIVSGTVPGDQLRALAESLR